MNVSNFDLAKLLKNSKNRIYRVGVELEGGWDNLPKFEHGEKIIRDGSVNVRLKNPRPANLVNEPFDVQNELALYNANLPQDMRVTFDVNSETFLDHRGRAYSRDRQRDYADRMRHNWINRTGQLDTDLGAPKYMGEVPSPVLERDKVADWIRLCYPSHVNETCGLHVHMSFPKSLHYSRLMVPEYQATILTYLGKWALAEGFKKDHPIWKRLSGENQYCKADFFADVQARKTSKSYDHAGQGNRYTVMNYCHGLHGTLECRVLPMFEDKEQAVRAVEEVLDITNACLRYQAKKEKAQVAILSGEANPIREDRVEYI